MAALGVLVCLLLIAAVTDIRSHWISNRLTYPGILLGLGLNSAGWGGLGNGWPATESALLGFLACGGLMVVAFVFFEIGGGDVKLLAMMGAFLGVERGIEALLWTFSLGFVIGMAIIIWHVGVVNLVVTAFQHLKLVIQSKGWIPLTTQERQPLQRGLFLAPSALAAAVLVGYRTWW